MDVSERMLAEGTRFGCDKVTHHSYHEFYGHFLDRIDGKTGAMVEIGVEEGRSLRMWLEVFPKFHFYGVDIRLTQNRVSTGSYDLIRADQSSQFDLNICAEILELSGRPLWLAVDDGSHIPEHQVATFNVLFEKLVEGGIYIIEDVEVSYWRTGELYGYPTSYGYGHPKSIVEIFKRALECVNSEFVGIDFVYTGEISETNLALIESITFSRNCIVVTKGRPAKSIYRFSDRTR